MAKSYLPTRDGELVTWSATFSTYIEANDAAVGLTADQTNAYSDAQDEFSQAYQVANDPVTRSPANVEDKNDKKQALIELTRQYVGIVQAYPGTTDVMRAAMGITIRDTVPSSIPVPGDAPNIDLVSMVGWTLSFRLYNGESTSRAKPDGVKGATVMSYVGESPPSSVDDWKFEGSITTTLSTIDFPTTLAAGTKVWVTAFWFNPTLQSGPAATPVGTQINYGGLSQAA